MKINGAWVAIGINCVIAVLGALQAVDWIHIAGASAGTVMSALSLMNMVLHAVAPAGPASPTVVK